jgi:hypothetical protein
MTTTIMKITAFWDIAPSSLIEVDQCFRCVHSLHHCSDVMESVCSPVTSFYFNKATWHYVPEGSNLQTHCCEDLKSHDENNSYDVITITALMLAMIMVMLIARVTVKSNIFVTVY